MNGERTAFPYRRILKNVVGMKEIEKSTFEHRSNAAGKIH